MNQHLQQAIAELQEFIVQNLNAREVRKGLAVKLVYQGYLPVQNPIEDVWLQAKTWVRRFCAFIPSFSHLKWMFSWFIRHTNE